jgi:hypothetical protein
MSARRSATRMPGIRTRSALVGREEELELLLRPAAAIWIAAFAFRFQDRLRHLLYEQRDTVGALDDVLPDVYREQLVAYDTVDHRADFALRQPIEGERGHVGPSNPQGLELRPERHDQQRRGVGTVLIT